MCQETGVPAFLCQESNDRRLELQERRTLRCSFLGEPTSMSEKPRRKRPITPRKMERKLTRAYKKAPGPSSLAALAEHYLRYQKFDRARKLVEEGLLKYPESHKLRLLEQRIKRTDLYEEFLKAGQEITENPNPDAYANLAALYRTVGDIDKSLETCAAGLAKFPNSVRIYLNVAELRISRYARDYMPRDAVIALANLEKAVSLDDTDYAAAILLSEFYMAVGAAESAIHALKKLLVSHPEDEHAQEMLDKALEMSRRDEPVEDLVRDISQKRRMAVEAGLLCYLEKCVRGVQDGKVRRRIDAEKTSKALTPALEDTGARAMVVLNPDGSLAAEARQEGDPINTEALALATREIHDNTNDYALRMDLGSFESGEIEGPFGHILVNSVEGWLISGITSARPSNRERMRKRMQEVAEDCLLTAPVIDEAQEEEEEKPDADTAQPDQGA